MRCKFISTFFLLGTLAVGGAQAAAQPFTASFQGSSQIVEVLDPGPPVVRFETTATGSGSFALLAYASTDIVNMATGAGTGTNVFTASNGDQLFGSFTVQILPTAVPGTVELLGLSTFNGGTGLFAGASGAANFIGSAVFTSPTSALATLDYTGSIALVPEPGSWLLMGLALAGAGPLLRRRLGAARK